MTYCFFKISTKPALVRSFPCTTILKSPMTSGGIKRFGAFVRFIVVEPSLLELTPLVSLMIVLAFGNKMLVQLTLLSGIRGGSMDACSDFEGEAFSDLTVFLEGQYAVE